ncbi:hypothetical protein [Sulfurovum sp. NBC37-1]|uniref:hypothetical protein n=1 Tax=Sulfurovum sp. (strain NBC37-1) TaxID=387093 RepID=UPI00015876BE|nr:hypothetical protein [Sulfurovum sp. NBC37-1]BAF71283.1 hypothetical protein SUN_0323 [Sulfurovum sp. NBC37-1]
MKKIGRLALAGMAIFALNGCGGGDTVIVDPGPELVTLYLVDEFGVGIDHVPYTCIDAYDEIIVDDVTMPDGEFTFALGDRCTFDLFGFPGDITVPLYIVDIDLFGKDDIPYECDNGIDFTSGVTDFDGWFAYPMDAYCKFHF